MAHSSTPRAPTRRRSSGPARRGPAPKARRERRRLSRRTLVLAGVVTAAVVAAAALAVALASGGSGGQAKPAPVTGASATAALLQGIPQHGTLLGSPTAPVKLVEYADLQCPYCAAWASDVLPTVLARYVRTGKVQLEYRGMAFLGPDSEKALRTALASAGQNRFWNVLELLFANQGAENSGWATDSLVAGVLAGVPHLDASRVLAARDGAAVTARLSRAESQARAAGINSTPSFELGRRGGALHRFEGVALDPAAFTAALRAELAG